MLLLVLKGDWIVKAAGNGEERKRLVFEDEESLQAFFKGLAGEEGQSPICVYIYMYSHTHSTCKYIYIYIY